ncbi:MAG: hypothetical protein HYU41_14365 [Candidatus Rokubacteria bacterium]|nr:hypothetical protein [Candidatus Rokubacteria bacterium]
MAGVAASLDTLEGLPPHAHSRFRSRENPRRLALYSLADTSTPGAALVRVGTEDHSLMVVREFRRVPLDASSLSLALFIARPGCASGAVAELAHFVERAVSAWEPSYVMLAQSLEQPPVIVLLAGVHQARALAGASATAFSVTTLPADLEPLLAEEPEIFEYCRDERAENMALVCPRAV